MHSDEIRSRFLAFFEKRGHKVIPSASLVPENDPSVLFNTAGMQPLVPYLMGAEHPCGKRLVNIQKCVRTQDIDEIGDRTHDTFFAMLGNWSLGDYFKADAIKWSYELLTSQEEGFGLDPKRLYVTVFEGNDDAPRDTETYEIWKKIGVPDNRIYFLPAKSNWWSPGDNGPCGPDSEMFYDITPEGLGDLTKEEYLAADENQQVVEIWNDVFMEYEKKDGQVIGKLKQQNVDTGAGLERLAMALQGKDNIFETDLFQPLMAKLDLWAPAGDIKAKRIIVDHIRTAVFMIGDGVTPSNTDRGYILRRLLRRAIRYTDVLSLDQGLVGLGLVDAVIEKYQKNYPNLGDKAAVIRDEILKEEQKFRKTLERGMREFEKAEKQVLSAKIPDVQIKDIGTLSLNDIKFLPGKVAFDLFQSYGFPIELTEELAREKNIVIDKQGFTEELKKHQDLSRQGAEQKFKGGLAGTSEQTIKYHTATHLLQQALVDVLGPQVEQKGSNITDERLRFDFAFERKLTDEEKKKVEEIVNEKIAADLPVQKVVLPRDEAEKSGARHLFSEKYGDEVNVYFIGDNLETAYSKEFCGGPHVDRTGVLGHFKISKEEAVAAGVRRIKAVLE